LSATRDRLRQAAARPNQRAVPRRGWRRQEQLKIKCLIRNVRTILKTFIAPAPATFTRRQGSPRGPADHFEKADEYVVLPSDAGLSRPRHPQGD